MPQPQESGGETRWPVQAGPGRRIFHTLVAVAGWVLFVYWWWLVFQRVSDAEIRYTVIFITISLVIIVAVTALWAFHNLRIFRHRGPRKAVRPVSPDFSHDRVGREVHLPPGPGNHPQGAVLVVKIVDGAKVYVEGDPRRLPGPVRAGSAS